MMVQVSINAAIAVAMTLLLAEQVLGFWRSVSNRLPAVLHLTKDLYYFIVSCSVIQMGRVVSHVPRALNNPIRMY
jgi:hypothetical protein